MAFMMSTRIPSEIPLPPISKKAAVEQESVNIKIEKPDTDEVIILPDPPEKVANEDDIDGIDIQNSTEEFELHPYHFFMDAIPPPTNFEQEKVPPPTPLSESEFQIVDNRDHVLAMVKNLKGVKEFAIEVITIPVPTYKQIEPIIIAISTDSKDYLIDLHRIKDFAVCMLTEVLINPNILKVFFHYRLNAELLKSLNLYTVNIFEIDSKNTLATTNIKQRIFKRVLKEVYKLEEADLMFSSIAKSFKPDQIKLMRMRTHFTLHMYHTRRNKILRESPNAYKQAFEEFKEMNRKFDSSHKKAEHRRLLAEIDEYRGAQDKFREWIYDWRERKAQELDYPPNEVLQMYKLKEVVFGCANAEEIKKTLAGSAHTDVIIAVRNELFKSVKEVDRFEDQPPKKEESPASPSPGTNPNGNTPTIIPLERVQEMRKVSFRVDNRFAENRVIGISPLNSETQSSDITKKAPPIPPAKPNPNSQQKPLIRAPVLIAKPPSNPMNLFQQQQISNNKQISNKIQSHPNVVYPDLVRVTTGFPPTIPPKLDKPEPPNHKNDTVATLKPPNQSNSKSSTSRTKPINSRSRSPSWHTRYTRPASSPKRCGGSKSSSPAKSRKSRSRSPKRRRYTTNSTRSEPKKSPSKSMEPPPAPLISDFAHVEPLEFCDDEDYDLNAIDEKISKHQKNLKHFSSY